jgi:transcriptional regulator with XRE-family HTH domain
MGRSAPNALALGRAIKAVREERGMTQMQLAAATGFTQSWISHVEHGRRNVSWSNIGRLAEGLGVRVSELAGRAED